MEKLVETGFLDPHGTGRGRTSTLSGALYRKAGNKTEYIRHAGFAPIQQELMVLNYFDKHGSIKCADVADFCHVSGLQATRLLKRLENNELLMATGRGKGGAIGGNRSKYVRRSYFMSAARNRSYSTSCGIWKPDK
jgi:ATP-dependent DNA helicase RecG